MKLARHPLLEDMAVEVPLLLWLGLALLIAGLVVAFLGHRPKRRLPPASDPTAPESGPPDHDLR